MIDGGYSAFVAIVSEPIQGKHHKNAACCDVAGGYSLASVCHLSWVKRLACVERLMPPIPLSSE